MGVTTGVLVCPNTKNMTKATIPTKTNRPTIVILLRLAYIDIAIYVT
jgi:hypothetical protein